MSYFLMEHCGILQEAEVTKRDSNKAIFTLAIQDADAINQNRRKYPKDVLSEGIKNCEPRIEARSFLGELDHPLPTGNFDEVRQTTVLLSEVSHLVRSYEWRGNVLFAEFETLSTPNGQKVLNLIKDDIGFGTSMRGMAELVRHPQYNLVKGPLYIVTYDLVSNPSHKIAKIDEQQIRFESITESASGLICVRDVKGKSQCYLPNYFDKLVEQKLLSFMRYWV